MATAAGAPANANEACVGPASEQAGKADGCAGCPNQSLCASGAARQPDPAVSDVKQRLAGVKHKLLVLSGKGGVGKSTVACQLAFALAGKGYQVGLLDVDITGPSVPRMLGLLGQEVHQSAAGWSPVYVDDNLGVMSIGFMLPNADDAIIWRGPKKSGIIKQFLVDVQWGELDYLIIDTPPGTSDEHISIVQYMKEADLDGAVVVTTPQEVALSDVRKELNFCRKTNINVLGVVENMSGVQRPLSDVTFVGADGNDQTEAFMKLLQEKAPELLQHSVQMEVFPRANGGGEAMAKKFNVPFLGRLPLDNKMTGACEEGVSFLEEYPDSVAAPAFGKIVQDIVASVEK
ncbi:cytosolic Fe-S cluster assembly factor nbp35 [Phytophthora boehmeriae]|uniref:Cytosolic Fe-S cluster assembly factor NUBP1 homolog n=1 Tax=Phytophthora boehmeriae TaxID=109152 RepID=A0A8T1WPD4_9STRA|nr:cytosolic Fe-S cluster assembly factor nbp35 [Phytophthora boehmeriae]